jgi:hypothetical protein
MMKTLSRFYLCGLLALVIFLAGCTAKATATPAPTTVSTPDPCAPANILVEVQKVHSLMREFDDASQVASLAPVAQMPTVIPPLQAIRRRAEDLQVPSCLLTLKSLQLTHMDAVINTMLVFMSGGNNPNRDALVQGIAQARTLHEHYNVELARLIGATYVPPVLTPASTATVAPGDPTATPVNASVKNEGTAPVNIRSQPDMNADTVGTLDAGQTIAATGKTADGSWIQVADQAGNKAWVFASLVTVTGGEALPVVTPTP